MGTTEYSKFIFKNPESSTIETKIVAELSIPFSLKLKNFQKKWLKPPVFSAYKYRDKISSC